MNCRRVETGNSSIMIQWKKRATEVGNIIDEVKGREDTKISYKVDILDCLPKSISLSSLLKELQHSQVSLNSSLIQLMCLRGKLTPYSASGWVRLA